MRHFVRLVAAAAVVLAGAAACGGAEEANEYLTKDGKLKETLEFRVGQEGFAGVTGTVWKCEPDGSWSVSRYVNDKVSEPERKGKLAPKELEALAKTLAAEEFSKLPKEFGRDSKVNRQLLTIRFGDKQTRCVLNPGETPQQAAPDKESPKAATWNHFIAIHQAIQQHLKGDEAPGKKPGEDKKPEGKP